MSAQTPKFHPVLSIGGVAVEMSSPLVHFVSGCAVDADGAPKCYHPSDWGPRAEWKPENRAPYGLDAPENGGRAHRTEGGLWVVDDSWGWATDDGQRNGRPVIQSSSDPAPGYYVSKTSLRDPSFGATDPRSYVWADKVPYVAVPRRLLEEPFGVRMGDLALVTYERKRCFAVVADVGSNEHIGEGSLALIKVIGDGESTPRKGGIPSGVAFYIFCGTARTFRFAPYHRDRVPGEIENAGLTVARQYGIL